MENAGLQTSAEGSSQIQELALKDINVIEEQLKQIENAIKDILTKLNGHAYGKFIRSMNMVEELTQEKKMSDGLIAIRVLQEILKMWKVFIGSEVLKVLKENLVEETRRHKETYGMTDEEIRDNIENIEIRTLKRTGEKMETERIFNIKTKGAVKFDETNNARTIPSNNESATIINTIELVGKLDKENKATATQNALTILGQFKVQWPLDAKGTIPNLFIVIEVINLMIAKIELTGLKVMINAMGILGQGVDGIIDRR